MLIIAVIATNRYWLIFKPMHVSMDVKGNSAFNIEVLLNKKDDNKFNKINSAAKTINRNNHINIYVENAKFPKKIRLVITDLQTENNIFLSNIEVGKYLIKNLDKFEISGATSSVKNNELILYPNAKIITLTYKDTLNVRASIKFNFKAFVIILILAFLLVYNYPKCIACFKNTQDKVKTGIELIFLAVFFASLFIPCHINKDEISKQENRTLAKWKPLIDKDKKINFEFSKNFDEWFSDRLFLRSSFIDLYDVIHQNLSKNIYNKKKYTWNKKITGYCILNQLIKMIMKKYTKI